MIRITDPTVAPAPPLPILQSLVDRVMIDRRNWLFLSVIAQITLIVLPSAILLFVIEPFRWWLGVLHLVLVLFGYLDKLILLVHNLAHRASFKPRFRFIHGWVEWVLQPLFGLTPHTYFAHHVTMHHPENNAPIDVSSTMRFQRDSILCFLEYVGRFYFWAMVDMTKYLVLRRRFKVLRRMLTGEISYLIFVAAMLTWKPLPALFVFVLPLFVTRFLMMAGNWGQHAFIDPDDPLNSYKNSITCINTRYNRRAFNDGYHVDHHLKPRQHWTELPQDLMRDPTEFEKNGSLIFEGVDFFMVWAALMLKAYGYLASHVVSYGEPRPKEEVIEMLKRRTRPFSAEAALDPSGPAGALPSPKAG